MYDYGYNYGYDSYDYGSTASAVGIFAGVGIVMWIIGMAVAVFSLICMWKLFKKAGKPGWASIVPIYNTIVMIEIAELPMWYIALFFVPFANIYAMFKIYIEIAHKFGKSTGFGIGMVFLGVIFIPMLAFGKAEYNKINDVSVNNNVNLQNNFTGSEQVNSNINVNMQNVNSQFNVMDVNSGMISGPMYDANMQNNGNMFQPVGNVNNNVNETNVNLVSNNFSQNDMNTNFNNMGMNSGSAMSSNPVVNSVSEVVNTPVMPATNMVSVNETVIPVMSVNNSIPEPTVTPGVNMNMAPQVMPVNTVNVVPTISEPMMSNTNVVSQPVMETPVVNSTTVGMMEPIMNTNVTTSNLGQITNNMTKICPNCGNQVDYNAIMCNNCGQNL